MSDSQASPSKVAIHGHLYQPPRRDPWTSQVPIEPTADPFHDWNARIAAECYQANAVAELGGVARNNYASLSFDVGPTLTEWLDASAPETLQAIREGDAASHARTGHGGAIAHPWVHAILPMCEPDDAATLVRWGIAEFVMRFGRSPEGMWLPETAMDIATLRILAEQGIRFTMAAPHQVLSARSVAGYWQPGAGTGAPIRVALGDGATIIVLPYHGALSNRIAFGGGLEDGIALAREIAEVSATQPAVVIATDMESYGHHHHFGEMALAAMIDSIESDSRLELTTVAEIVENTVPVDGVLALPSAWSCAHGIERWRSDCGCRSGPQTPHDQSWRAPLRSALDVVRSAASQLPELAGDLCDPAAARNAYCDVLLGIQDWDSFADTHVKTSGDSMRAHTWLALQFHLLSMYSSCGWFFDDAAGHETLIVLRQCRRAIELVRELGGPDLEPLVIERLASMVSDLFGLNGTAIWNELTHST